MNCEHPSQREGKKAKKDNVCKSEDVPDYKGGCSVDELVAFIDTGRKPGRDQRWYETNDLISSSRVIEKKPLKINGKVGKGSESDESESLKKDVVESDSGFGDWTSGDNHDELVSPVPVDVFVGEALKVSGYLSIDVDELVSPISTSGGLPSDDCWDSTFFSEVNSFLVVDSDGNVMMRPPCEEEFVIVQKKKKGKIQHMIAMMDMESDSCNANDYPLNMIREPDNDHREQRYNQKQQFKYNDSHLNEMESRMPSNSRSRIDTTGVSRHGSHFTDSCSSMARNDFRTYQNSFVQTLDKRFKSEKSCVNDKNSTNRNENVKFYKQKSVNSGYAQHSQAFLLPSWSRDSSTRQPPSWSERSNDPCDGDGTSDHLKSYNNIDRIPGQDSKSADLHKLSAPVQHSLSLPNDISLDVVPQQESNLSPVMPDSGITTTDIVTAESNPVSIRKCVENKATVNSCAVMFLDKRSSRNVSEIVGISFGFESNCEELQHKAFCCDLSGNSGINCDSASSGN